MLEFDYYPILENWMKIHFRCFKTGINVGTSYSRADVVGVRGTGGENSVEIELIVVEVKRGKEPFATASGQAAGYSVYANRVYLADVREGGFTPSEREIASNLGVGLIAITKKRPKEILSSREHKPIARMWFEMARKLNLFQCRICGSFVEVEAGYRNLTRDNVLKAIKAQTGLIYWHEEVADRKKKLKLARHGSENSHERRIVCGECVSTLLAPLS